MNDQDLELLESYLDDELTGRELESLRQRLSSEPHLSATIDELRTQREARQLFFAACEPDEASVQRLIKSANRAATREVVWGERNRALRWVSGLAACLVVGFVTGRGLHMTNSAPADSGGAVARNVSSISSSQDNQLARNDDRIRFDGPRVPVNVNTANTGSIDFSIRNPGIATVDTQDPFAGDRILIVDGSGRLVQRFDSHEQYMKFVDQKLHPTTQP